MKATPLTSSKKNSARSRNIWLKLFLPFVIQALILSVSIENSESAEKRTKEGYARVGSFEIQTTPITRGDWYEAALICAAKEGGRLCRPAEWIAACRYGAIATSRLPEWVDQLTPIRDEYYSSKKRIEEGFRALGMLPDCQGGVWFEPKRERLPVRCCRDSY